MAGSSGNQLFTDRVWTMHSATVVAKKALDGRRANPQIRRLKRDQHFKAPKIKF